MTTFSEIYSQPKIKVLMRKPGTFSIKQTHFLVILFSLSFQVLLLKSPEEAACSHSSKTQALSKKQFPHF
jgi:hypothetical protein